MRVIGAMLYLAVASLASAHGFTVADRLIITRMNQPSPDSGEQIKQLERDRQDAFVRGDVATLEQSTSDDYTTINSGGKLSDKPHMMSNLRAAKTKVLSVKLDDLKARIYGRVAVLTGQYDDVHVTNGVRAAAHAVFTRVFVKDKGSWQAVAYQQTASPAE
jgi:Domain of unknown function (DUF4440)